MFHGFFGVNALYLEATLSIESGPCLCGRRDRTLGVACAAQGSGDVVQFKGLYFVCLISESLLGLESVVMTITDNGSVIYPRLSGEARQPWASGISDVKDSYIRPRVSYANLKYSVRK